MRKFGKALGWTLLVVGVVVGLLRVILFEPWQVPEELTLSASIYPTLDGGDYVLVLKRFKPGFGNLVRCKDPDDPAQWVIGRIVGVEGDTVEVNGRNVLVNGKRYMQLQACPERKYRTIHPNTEAEVEMQCGIVEMGGGWHYRGNVRSNNVPGNYKAAVGEGMVYLLSDNIDLHDDSRDFGTVERASCTERIVFRLVSKNGWQDEEPRLTVIR